MAYVDGSGTETTGTSELKEMLSTLTKPVAPSKATDFAVPLNDTVIGVQIQRKPVGSPHWPKPMAARSRAPNRLPVASTPSKIRTLDALKAV